MSFLPHVAAIATLTIVISSVVLSRVLVAVPRKRTRVRGGGRR